MTVDDRRAGRQAAWYALVPGLFWLAIVSGVALAAPGLHPDFRAHLFARLAMFCVIIMGPLVAVALTLNWIVRRIAGGVLALSFLGMSRGGLSQGFSVITDIFVVLVLAFLIGSMLSLLSRRPLTAAVGDGYNFLSIRDLFSKYTFCRKPT